MATVPTGYVFWDVSANKSYAAGSTMPTVGNGDYMVPATTSQDGHYHTYIYYTSLTGYGGITVTEGWAGYINETGTYTSLTQKIPFNSIGDKPVKIFMYSGSFSSWPTGASQSGYNSLESLTNMEWITFRGCPNLSGTAPNMPVNIISLEQTFMDTKITNPPANFGNLSKLFTCANCFKNLTTLTSAPSLPSNLKNAMSAFWGCTSLTSGPAQIPASLENASNMFRDCTGITTPPEFAANSNAFSLHYMYYGCTSLTSAPTIPASASTIHSMFYGCTSLVGNIVIESNDISNSTGCFTNTDPSKTIILLGNANNQSDIVSIANNYSNVYPGAIAIPVSLTAIRGIYNSTLETFTETIMGTYCKLTLGYTAPSVSGAKFMIPTVTNSENEELSLTWHLDTVDGTVITSAGYQLQTNDNIVSIINLGSSETSDTYTLHTNTTYTYNNKNYSWSSGNKSATLTYSNALIDINPLGTGIAFWAEVRDDYVGMHINQDVNINGDLKINNTLLLDYFHPVGSYYETSNTTFNPNTAWGGTWELELAGQVHVSAGTGYAVSGATTNTTDGGEKTHKLTTAEMPNHIHKFQRQQWYSADAEVSGTTTGTIYSWKSGTGGTTSKGYQSNSNVQYGQTGGDEAHNNMQPYIIVNRWHRTA